MKLLFMSIRRFLKYAGHECKYSRYGCEVITRCYLLLTENLTKQPESALQHSDWRKSQQIGKASSLILNGNLHCKLLDCN